jgi:hypothetical protein
MSASLRELALRAHELVRATGEARSGSAASARESKLIELHAQIVQLERNLGAHRGDDLATYVAALRERVEECLE